MTYELARKLKDAGFPQTQDCGCRVCHDGEIGTLNHHRYIPPEIDVRFPTLSELIDACGRNLVSLHQIPTIIPKGNEFDDLLCPYNKNFLKDNRWFWSAKWHTGNAENIIVNVVDGDTPEEAVANLWLKLNH